MADLYRVAVDLIVESDKGILLIRRKQEPFKDKWCLPGGHVDKNETVEEAAVRELKEETSISVNLNSLKLVGVYSDPDRDPREPRAISVCFYVRTNEDARAGSDAEEARYFPLDKIPHPLGFDHSKMVEDAFKKKLFEK
ncbi:NUDIX hydrolase [Candidatus Micrarchaeota archaeon]|nr:MAG: NUDIX hydrolase [Candidatus Micrarchaeota archaeon]